MYRAINLLILFSLFYAAAGEGRELYRYVDEQGRVQFSDRPPNSEAETITVKPIAPTGGGGLRPEEKRLADEIEARRQQARQQRNRAAEQESRAAARAAAATERNKARQCAHLARTIDDRDRRLRAGYSAADGVKWRRERDNAQRDAFQLQCP